MADDLKLKVKLEVDDKVDTSKVKKQAENAGKELGENINKWMSGAIVKGMAIWESVKGAIKKVWDMTKQFLADSISLANSYESAFAWVKKTVDGTAQEFNKLDNSLKKLAKEIPMTYQELAGIMELGGQLGVETKNLDKFTKAVAELGTATNLTNENAAQMLAQFANITNMDLNDIDRLGSVIVDLGNNFATTEADIVNFAQRIAGAGQIAGISQQNIMAIATAFSSVGIEAEAWGTAVQKVILDMNSAVTMGGDQLEKYANMVWMTTDEFKKLYNEHPEQVFIEFVKALQNSGQEAQKLLSDLWLDDQRLVRGFLSLSQNADLLKEAIDRSNTAWEDNIALSNEAEQRFGTTESQMIMQQNERANMMAEIWEKLQGIALTWESIKTTFVNAIGSFLGVTMESNDATEQLEAQIQKTIGAMNDLDTQLANGTITLEERTRKKIEMTEQMEEAEKAYKEEKKRLHELQEEIDDTKDTMKVYQDQYERNFKLYGENDTLTKDSLKNYEKYKRKLEELQMVQEAGIPLTQEEINKRIEQKEYLAKVEKAADDLKKAEAELNAIQINDQASRADLEASRQKVIQLRGEYEKLKSAMAQVWIGKSLKGVLNKNDEARQNVLNDIIGKIEAKATPDDGGVLGDTLLWGKGSGGGKSSKAGDMLKEYGEELTDLYNDMDSTLNDHQSSYDKITKSIEKVEDEYAKLREEASKTWRDAQESLEEYSEQLDKLQNDTITNLGQRYVELRKDLMGTDEYMKKIAEELSRKEIQAYQDWGQTEYRGYDLKKLVELKEKLDEIKLIEENTTEEQRKAEEFTHKTSKAQEILNKLNEQAAEIEEKKAAALEKQAIAQAQMSTENGKQNVFVREMEDGTLKGIYKDREGQRQLIHDIDNLEYAKQLSDQTTNLGIQLDELQKEKDKEVQILVDVNARKKQVEEEYTRVFNTQVELRKKGLDEEIARMDKLIAKKREYLSMSFDGGVRAYGGELNKWVTLVGENWPEAIIRRQASYVQPRNAVQNYSTVNNTSSNLNINGLELGYNSIDDMLADLKSRLSYRN